jgi:hypothetical protein
MRKPRPKYKQLYVLAEQARKSEQRRAERLEQRLKFVNRSLVSFGRRTLEQIQPPEDPTHAIGLLAHEYVAAEAFLNSVARHGAVDALSGWNNIAWRGRPIGWLGEIE